MKLLTASLLGFFLQLMSFPGHAAFIYQGEQAIFNFNATDFSASASDSSNSAGLTFSYTNHTVIGGLGEPFVLYSSYLEADESLRIEYYNNQGDSSPFDSTIIYGEDPSVAGHGQIWLDPFNDGSSFVPWTDLEGSVVLTVLAGEIEIHSPGLGITLDGIQYSTELHTTPVPLPPALLLLLSSLLPLLGYAGKNSKQRL